MVINVKIDITSLWEKHDGRQVIPKKITVEALRISSADGNAHFWQIVSYCKKEGVDPDATIPIVAIRGGRGDDFAVYIGLPHPDYLSDNQSRIGISTMHGTIRHGFKVGEDTGRHFFPQLKNYHYRK